MIGFRGRSGIQKNVILWRAIALISVVSFTGLLVYRGRTDFILLPSLGISYSLLIFRAFLLNKPMHLGGFTLDSENIALRLFFLIFGVLVWVTSFVVIIQ